MVQRTNGGVFDQQILTGSLSHWVISGADFSGAINQYGKPVPGSAAEIIFKRISDSATVNIMNPNSINLSFALEEGRSTWDEASLTELVQSLGTDVGIDHIDCTLCIVSRVPYIWGASIPNIIPFTDLSDVPHTYSGSENYIVTVNSAGDGLVFMPLGITDNYISITAGTMLIPGNRYFVTTSGTVTLPDGTNGAISSGTSIVVTKKVDVLVYVNTTGISDTINTDLGSTDSIEIDVTEECVFVFDGVSTWNLQIGSAN